GDCFRDLRRGFCYPKRGSPWSTGACFSEQGLDTLRGVGQCLQHRLCPACKNGEVISFKNARCWCSGVGFRPVRARATGPYLVDGHIEILSCVVDGLAAVRASSCCTTATHGKENALGTRLQSNLAESSHGILQQSNHG